MRSRTLFCWARKSPLALLAVCVSASPGWAQKADGAAKTEQTAALADSLQELQAQVRELKTMIADMRAEVAHSRAETQALRQELEATRTPMTAGGTAVQSAGDSGVASATPAAQATEQRLTQLEEQQELLGGKINEQYQTKVESASKYRVRLSGIVLANFFSNQGVVENQDVPTWASSRGALDSSGSFGATLRQSQLGLEVFGPELAGARTRADVQFDFFGGFPADDNGVSNGIIRMRTATFRLDWANTSVIAGQDALFISPLSPTSLASLARPALSYAGNLWEWAPQIRVEHRFDISSESSIKLQGGILDGLTGETPSDPFLRFPQAGERAQQPAYATRASWSHRAFGRTMTVGIGGYYNREKWGFGRNVDGWAATSDWLFPLGSRWDFSGEFYRGRAVGGLGGGITQSVVFVGLLTDPATVVRGLDSTGGWAQLKFRATDRLEFNGAFGQDNPQARELRVITEPQAALARNQSGFVNFIYQPRSDLLFSMEYRRLRTFYTPDDRETAGHINLSVGVLF
jgi:hypothetical protein